MNTDGKKQGLFIPLALIGTIVGVLVSALAAATTWGGDRERLRAAELEIQDIKMAIKDIAEIKGDVKSLAESVRQLSTYTRGQQRPRNGE